jgi:hypothetical protein
MTKLMSGMGIAIAPYNVAGISVKLASTPAYLHTDDFDRADNENIGGDWTAEPGQARILNNELDVTPGNSWYHAEVSRNDIDLPDEYILQCNMEVLVAATFAGICWRAAGPSPAADTQYFAGFSGGGFNRMELTRYTTGSSDWQELDSGPNTQTGDWRGIRVHVKLNAGTLEMKAYYTAALTDGDDVSKTFTLGPTHDDASPLTETDIYGMIHWQNVRYDMFRLMGPNIVVSGMPTGYKVKIDSQAAVTESGGTATIAPGVLCTYPGAMTTLYILNGDDETVAQVSPDGGIFGGMTFTVS